MPYDLFISYARRDNEQGRVSELVTEIERDLNRGLGRPVITFFDTQAIQGMQDWRDRILQGLRESRLLVTVISPTYLASEYCEWEFVEYLNHEAARGVAGAGVAPIYFVEASGWSKKGFDGNAAEWLRDLRRRQYFDLRSFYRDGPVALNGPQTAAIAQHLGQCIREQLRQGQALAPGLGNVDRHNPNFQGRVADLRRLHETLTRGQVGVLAAVHGLGGMGKTALALEYAHVYGYEYGGGRWQVRCEGRDDLRLALANLARDLGLQFSKPESVDPDLQFARVLAELRRLSKDFAPNRCLLILDNVDRTGLLESARMARLPAADWLHVIVTTRLGEEDIPGYASERRFLLIDELPEAEAVALIESYQSSGRFPSDSERNAAIGIVRLLGGLTLAIEVAAVVIGQFAGSVTCAGFLERLRREGLTGLETAAAETSASVRHGEKRVSATLAPTLEHLTGPEILALRYAALMPPDAVALPWLRELIAREFPRFGKDAEPGYPDPWLMLLRRLTSLRLLQPTEAGDSQRPPLVARMHRLLGEVVRQQADFAQDDLQEKLIDYARKRGPFLERNWLDWETRWELGPLSAFADSLLTRGHPSASEISAYAGIRLMRLARFHEAEPLLRRSLESVEVQFGANGSIVADCLDNYSILLAEMNRLEEAEPLARRALKIDEQIGDPNHRRISHSLNSLAALLMRKGEYAEAELLSRRSLQTAEKVYGPDSAVIANRLNNLASAVWRIDNLKEAETLFRRALVIKEKHFGPSHPDVASGLRLLADLLLETGRVRQAEPLMRRALEINETVYGPTHPAVALSLSSLANLFRDTNRAQEAEPLLRRALEINQRCYGPRHPDVADSLDDLGSLLWDIDQIDEAENLHRKALEIFEASFGPVHAKVGHALSNLGHLLAHSDRFAEAEPLLRRALTINQSTYGHHNTHVAVQLNNLAGVLKDTGRATEAEPMMRKALVMFEQGYGPDHPRVATSLVILGNLLAETNREIEAENLFRRALGIYEKLSGRTHRDVARALGHLASLLRDSGRSEEAIPLMRRALKMFRKIGGPEHPDTIHARNKLSRIVKSANRIGYT